jgi:hypothetical protein
MDMITYVAKYYLTMFASKVRLYNLQTNSQLPFDLPALLEVLTRPSSITYHDKHPYTEIKRHISEHLYRLMKRRALAEQVQVQKSLELTQIHLQKLQDIRIGDYFTCTEEGVSQLKHKHPPLEFQVLEITSSASVRLRPLQHCPIPEFNNPQGFIVRVSQQGIYRLRIYSKDKPNQPQSYIFQHQPIWKPCIWLHTATSHPLFHPSLFHKVLSFMYPRIFSYHYLVLNRIQKDPKQTCMNL